MVPEQERLPVSPLTVHPVSADPPANAMVVAVFEAGPMFIEVPAPNALIVVGLELKSARVPLAVE